MKYYLKISKINFLGTQLRENKDKSTSNKFGCIDCGQRNAVAVTPDETQMRK